MPGDRVASPHWFLLGLIAVVSPVVAFACWLAVGAPLDLLLTGGTDEVVISHTDDIWLVMTPAAVLAGILLGLIAGIRGWWLAVPSLLAVAVSGVAYAVMLANGAHPIYNAPSYPVLFLCIAAGAMLGALIVYLTGHGRPAPDVDATSPAPANVEMSRHMSWPRVDPLLLAGVVCAIGGVALLLLPDGVFFGLFILSLVLPPIGVVLMVIGGVRTATRRPLPRLPSERAGQG